MDLYMEMCENGGCQAKISGNELEMLLNDSYDLSNLTDDRNHENTVEVEDCAIINISGSTILFTTDFGPAIGTNPRIAGRIASLHAISDIYSMGGKPIGALVILTLGKETTIDQAKELLQGLKEACKDEKVSVLGGHTIRGKELLVGLSVIGLPSEHGILLKKNCKVGDSILISKPLGTGLMTRARYHKIINDDEFNDSVDVMLHSNNVAIKAFSLANINAMTDVTGFGFLGHLSEMLSDNQGASVYYNNIPFVPHLEKLNFSTMMTKYIESNLLYTSNRHIVDFSIDSIEKMALFDPQTNGPIMVSVPSDSVSILENIGFYTVAKITDNKKIELV